MVSDVFGRDAELAGEVAELKAWLRDSCLPLWLAKGVDRARGGFFEALDLRTHRCVAPFRRLRVVARQIYVFSEASKLGVAGAEEAVHLGLRFLEAHAVLGEGGYAWRFDLDHRPIDTRRDFYDHAFVLFALASASAVAGAGTLRPKALALLAWLDGAFSHPSGGYVESLPSTLPRRQNPHMHLLEALLTAFTAFGDDYFLEHARGLTALFAERFFDPATGAVPEYFDEALKPLRTNGTFQTEPGHHCEWVWLLHRAQVLGIKDPRLPEMSARLLAFTGRHGINPTNTALIDEVASNGTALALTARLWPQTERVRAEFVRSDGTAASRLEAVRSLRAYLRPDGLWHERRHVDGSFSDEPAPASSLYHLTGAILGMG